MAFWKIRLCAFAYGGSIGDTTHLKLADIENMEFSLELHFYSLVRIYAGLSGTYAIKISDRFRVLSTPSQRLRILCNLNPHLILRHPITSLDSLTAIHPHLLLIRGRHTLFITPRFSK